MALPVKNELKGEAYEKHETLKKAHVPKVEYVQIIDKLRRVSSKQRTKSQQKYDFLPRWVSFMFTFIRVSFQRGFDIPVRLVCREASTRFAKADNTWDVIGQSDLTGSQQTDHGVPVLFEQILTFWLNAFLLLDAPYFLEPSSLQLLGVKYEKRIDCPP